jgi:hypothetical protein
LRNRVYAFVTAAPVASVWHWQRRSGARLHSCRFAHRLPLSAANARPKHIHHIRYLANSQSWRDSIQFFTSDRDTSRVNP